MLRDEGLYHLGKCYCPNTIGVLEQFFTVIPFLTDTILLFDIYSVIIIYIICSNGHVKR